MPDTMPHPVSNAATADALAPLYPDASLSMAWQAMCHYYASRLPLHQLDDPTPELRTVGQVLHLAQALGLEAHSQALTPMALLNQEFPVLVAPNSQQAYWVVGKRGTQLLVRQGSASVALPLAAFSQQAQGHSLLEVTTLRPTGQHRPVPKAVLFSLPWFLGQYLKQGWLTVQLLMASAMVQVFALGMPLLYMVIFDRVFGRQNLATLDVVTVGVGVLLLFDLGVKQVRTFVLSHLLQQLDKQVVDAFLDKVFSLNLSSSLHERMRGFVEQFSLVSASNQAMATLCLITSMDVAFSALVAAVLFVLDWPLALIAMAPMVPMVALSLITIPSMKRHQAAFEADHRHYRLKLTEALDEAETLKAVDADQRVKAAIKTLYRDTIWAPSQQPLTNKLQLASMQGLIASLGALVLLYVGASRVLDGQLSFGVYLAVNMLSRAVVGNVQKLLENINQVQDAQHKLQHLNALYHDGQQDASPEGAVVLDHVAGDIDLNNVSFRYDERLPLVLDTVQLNLKAGQKVVLTGRSGSGKSTLLRLLQRLYVPTQGTLHLDGFKLSDLDHACLRQLVGVAVQRPGLLTGTLRDNIALGSPDATLRQVIEAATMAQLDDVISAHPLGLEQPINFKGSNLSGGQMARVALARVFLRRPSVLCLDEATNAVEPNLKATLFRHVLDQFASNTCIFVTDFMPLHQHADLIVVLHQGSIVEQGTFQQLMKLRGYYYLLHKHQLPPVLPSRPTQGSGAAQQRPVALVNTASPVEGTP
jgi:ATP-binding cassette, subfamily B, bacterial HlyB/CyaB